MKVRLFSILVGGLLACVAMEANATVFGGSATGSWTDVVSVNPYNGDGDYNPPITPVPPEFDEDIFHTFNNDGGALPADSAIFQWGLTRTADGLYPSATDTIAPYRNQFEFNGVGSDGNLGWMDTDNPLLNPFAFGTFDYFNGSTYYSTGVNGVTLDIDFYIEDFFNIQVDSFAMQMKFEIENISNVPYPTSDNVNLINGHSLTRNFSSNGKYYQFEIMGFSDDGGQTITTDFSSPEGITASAELYARINEVPEPATFLLFGVGMVGLVGAKMRKKKV